VSIEQWTPNARCNSPPWPGDGQDVKARSSNQRLDCGRYSHPHHWRRPRTGPDGASARLGGGIGRSAAGHWPGPALKINACSRLPAICRGRGTWSRIAAVMWSQPELRRGRTFGAARARMMHTLYGRVQLLRSGKSTLTACISRSTARSTQIQMPPTWCGSAVFRRSSPARPPWSTEAAGEKTLIDPGMAASDSHLGRCPGRVEPPCRTMG
jgi:hypothetical protein